MKLCNNTDAEFKFHHYFNIDRGTVANVDHIRNCMLYYMKKKLNIDQTETSWTNKHDICFDFTKYYVVVGQELFHLVIRCRNKRIWNYMHSDCWYVIRAFQTVATQYQHRYDIKTTPDIISDYEQTPYEVYEMCTLLTNDRYFEYVQNVIICYLRLVGTNSYSELSTELTQVLISERLYDKEEGLLSKAVVAKMLCWCYDHLTPRSIARFESVKYTFLLTLLFLYT